MTVAVTVPPIKSQGIKTKLVPWINDLILTSGTDINARWITAATWTTTTAGPRTTSTPFSSH